jgi:hypothetical protein
MSQLKNLNSIWKSLNEAEDVSRETEAKSEQNEPKKEDTVAVSAVSVSAKVETSSKKSL